MTPATASAPVDLRVEYEDTPENVDPRTDPRFSWRVATDRRGARQVAYRVVVGRDAERVGAGEGGLWDSGRVESAASTEPAGAQQRSSEHAPVCVAGGQSVIASARLRPGV